MYINFIFTSYVYQGAKIQNILGELCFEYLLSAEFLTLVFYESTSYQGLLQPGSYNFDMTDSIFENVAQNNPQNFI